MERFGQWLIGHPLTVAVTTLVVSCSVSVFAGDLRRFLAIPPQKLNIWILKTRISSAEAKLRRLNALADIHSLLLYLSGQIIVGLLFLALMMSTLFVVIDSHVLGHPASIRERLMFLLATGLAVGFLVSAIYELIAFMHPKEVQEKVQRLTEKLPKKTATRATGVGGPG